MPQGIEFYQRHMTLKEHTSSREKHDQVDAVISVCETWEGDLDNPYLDF